jgi:hypothetical protein
MMRTQHEAQSGRRRGRAADSLSGRYGCIANIPSRITPIRSRSTASCRAPRSTGASSTVAASEAVSAGHGGIAAVAAATGIVPSTIGRGIEELSRGEDRLRSRVRRPDGGRKPTIEKDPTLLADLEALVEPTSRRSDRCAGRARACAGWRAS